MKKEEALMVWLPIIKMGVENMQECNEALNMAIEALKQKPCEDAISRQAVNKLQKYRYNCGDVTITCVSLNSINELPPVTPQPKIGHWIRWYEQKECDLGIEYTPHCKCSECGKEYDSHSSQFIKYCNECGAKMQEVKE